MAGLSLQLLERQLPGLQEDRYRRHYLGADVSMAVFGILFVMVPLTLLAYSDYLVHGFRPLFFLLATLRLSFLCFSALLIIFLRRIQDYHIYDWMIICWAVIGACLNVTIQYFRPAEFTQNVAVDMVLILVFYLVIPCRQSFRVIAASLFTLGEMAILIFFRQPLGLLTANVTYLSYVLVNIVGLVTSARLYTFRRERFKTQEKDEEMTRELELMAATDELTGILTRRKFLELAESEVERFNRYRRPFSFLMFDLDHFKSVNDRYGHFAGDTVLKEFTAVVKRHIRNVDLFGRVGGEEFGAVLIETPLQEACNAAERIRQAFQAVEITINGEIRVRVTVSIGVAQASAELGTLNKIMSAADTALYLAKQRGRNRAEAAK